MEYTMTAQDKTGGALVIRSLTAKEAPAALWLMNRCMGETLYLSRYPDELRFTVAQEEAFIESVNRSPEFVLLGAFAGEEMIGLCSTHAVMPHDRYRHRASLGIMIEKAHWGRGIGGAMLRALIEAVKRTAVEQIELDAVSTNTRAIALYERFGFVRYGLLERGIKYRDGTYADLVLMKLELNRER